MIPTIGRWLEEEVRLLRQHYPFSSTREVALLLERSAKSVECKAKQLGLTKNEDYLSRIRAQSGRPR